MTKRTCGYKRLHQGRARSSMGYQNSNQISLFSFQFSVLGQLTYKLDRNSKSEVKCYFRNGADWKGALFRKRTYHTTSPCMDIKLHSLVSSVRAMYIKAHRLRSLIGVGNLISAPTVAQIGFGIHFSRPAHRMTPSFKRGMAWIGTTSLGCCLTSRRDLNRESRRASSWS